MPANAQNISRITISSGFTIAPRPASAWFGQIVYEPGGSCGPRRQTEIELLVVHTGEANCRSHNEEFYVPPEHVALLRPCREELTRFSNHSQTHHSWCCLGFSTPARTLMQELHRLPRVVPLSRRMMTLMQAGLSLGTPTSDAEHQVARSLAEAMLYEFAASAAGDAHPGPPWPDALDRAQRFVDEHLSEPLQLNQIADAACVSCNHLIRLCRAHLGTTPVRLLWQRRTQRGAALLRDTGLTVAQAADRCGFSSEFHFSRLIKALYGVPPRVLRQQYWRRGRTAVP